MRLRVAYGGRRRGREATWKRLSATLPEPVQAREQSWLNDDLCHRHAARRGMRPAAVGDGYRPWGGRRKRARKPRRDRPARNSPRKAKFDVEDNYVAIGANDHLEPLGVHLLAGGRHGLRRHDDRRDDRRQATWSTAGLFAPPPWCAAGAAGACPHASAAWCSTPDLRTEPPPGATKPAKPIPRPATPPSTTAWNAARAWTRPTFDDPRGRRRGRADDDRTADPRLRGWAWHVHRRCRAADLSRRRRSRRRRAVELREATWTASLDRSTADQRSIRPGRHRDDQLRNEPRR